ncbi:MAG: hypothetical protein V1720_11940 [bacterium]
MNKNRLVIVLLIIAIVLLLGNVAVSLFKKKAEKPEQIDSSVMEITQGFLKILDDYGIEEEWIRTKKYKPADDDSINSKFEINLPYDLPIPLILKELSDRFSKNEINILNEEKAINGGSSLKIYSGGYLKLNADINYNKQLQRNRSKILMIIIDYQNLDELLGITYPFTIALLPSFNSETDIKKLKEYKHDFVILIGDEITESNFKLDESFDRKRLSSSVKAVSTVFADAKYCVYDNASEISKSPVFSFIRDEFQKQHKKIISKAHFKDLTTTDIDEVKSLLKFYCETGDTNSVFHLIITSENFLNITGEVDYFKKRGNTFITAKEGEL